MKAQKTLSHRTPKKQKPVERRARRASSTSVLKHRTPKKQEPIEPPPQLDPAEIVRLLAALERNDTTDVRNVCHGLRAKLLAGLPAQARTLTITCWITPVHIDVERPGARFRVLFPF
jgi:hypothetical protein